MANPTPELRLERQTAGTNANTWGDICNVNFALIEDAISGMKEIATTGGTTTLTTANAGASYAASEDQARYAILKITGVLTSNATIVAPAVSKKYHVWNATSGAFTVTVKVAGTGVVVSQGEHASLVCDGTEFYSLYKDSGFIDYLPAGAGAVATTVQAKLRESVSVKDFGAKGDFFTDDTVAIKACIAANPGKSIHFPEGGYRISETIVVSADNTWLVGSETGTSYIQPQVANIDAIRFAPTTSGTTSAFLNSVGITGINVSHAAVNAIATLGAGIRFLQCNNFKLYNCAVNNAAEGIVVQGGQFGSLKSFQIFAATGIDPSVKSSLLRFAAAPYGAGLRQPMYTMQVEDFRLSATSLRSSCIRIEDVDGLNFANGYVAYGDDSLVAVELMADDDYISGVYFVNTYFDCVNASSTPTAIIVSNDAFSNTFVYGLSFDSCTFGNGNEYGFVNNKVNAMQLGFSRCSFLNFGEWAIASEAGSSSYTDLSIVGCQFNNVGGVASGAIRANNGRSLSVVGNTFSSVDNVIVNIGGTWSVATITGNTNSSNVSDVGGSGTVTYGLNISGNSSRWTGAGSWKTGQTIYAQASVNFASVAVGAFATQTVTVTGAIVGDVVTVNLNSGGQLYSDGTSTFLFTGGVTGANTVSLRVFNLAGITTTLGTLALSIAVHSS